MNHNETNRKDSNGNQRWREQYNNRQPPHINEMSEWAKKEEITKRKQLRLQQVNMDLFSFIIVLS